MLKLTLITLALAGSFARSEEPARRERGEVRYEPARALCKDETYKCMYQCEVKTGSACRPTRDSDPNCPARTVSGGKGFVSRGQTIVLWFGENRDMGCYVTKTGRTNLTCGNFKFGYECRTGRMHDEN